MTKTPNIVSGFTQLVASIAGGAIKTAARPVIDRFAMMGEYHPDAVQPDDIRPPVMRDVEDLDAELKTFDHPLFIGCKVDARPPMPYVTWLDYFRGTNEMKVRHTLIAPLLGMLAKHGSLTRKKDHYLYQLSNGRRIGLHYVEEDSVDFLTKIDFSLEGKTDQQALPGAQHFLDILREHRMVDEVFKKNIYFEQEKTAYRRWHSDPAIVDLPKVGLKDLLMGPWKWDILIIPDIHSVWKEIELIEELLYRDDKDDRYKIDWIAAEMFRASQQKVINRYLGSPGGAGHMEAEKNELEKELVEHERFQLRLWSRHARSMLKGALVRGKQPDSSGIDEGFIKRPTRSELLWRGLGELKHDLKRGWDSWLGTSSAPYFKMMVACRERDMRLYGMNCERGYILLNYTERERVPWLMGAENGLWASRVPAQGKGIVFGGLMHFTRFPGVRVQDFLAERLPGKRIVIADFS